MAKFDLVHLRETWERLKVVSASLNKERDRFRESCAQLAATGEEYQAAITSLLDGINRACIELDAGPCPKCHHPMQSHSSAGCHWHKVVIDGDLYDSGEVCDCKQAPYSRGLA